VRSTAAALTIALLVSLFSGRPAVEAQEAGKVHRIGLLSTSFGQRAGGL